MSSKFRNLLIIIFAALLAMGVSAGQNVDITEAAGDIGDLNIFSSAIEDAGYVDALMADKGRLRTVMGYHIIDRRTLSEDGIGSIEAIHGSLALMIVQGTAVHIGNDGILTVNGVSVLASRRYDNGMVYAIGRVLDPNEGADIPYLDMS